jgi:hypothetical protein
LEELDMATENTDQLLSVYEVERQDDQNAGTIAFAIVAAGLTYVVAGLAYLYSNCTNQDEINNIHGGCTALTVPLWIQLSAPAITAALVGFLGLNLAATRMRSVHLQRLEAALICALRPVYDDKTPLFHTDAGLVWRPDAKLDGWDEDDDRIHLVFTVITIFTYTIVNIVMVAFTWLVLLPGSWTVRWGWLKWPFALLYGAVAVFEVASFMWPLRHKRFRSEDLGVTSSL